MQQVPPDPQGSTGVEASHNASANSGGCCTTGTDLTKGFHKVGEGRIPVFSDEVAGGEEPAGNPMTFGGFLGRPNGWQR
jgi:hypothetical protein